MKHFHDQVRHTVCGLTKVDDVDDILMANERRSSLLAKPLQNSRILRDLIRRTLWRLSDPALAAPPHRQRQGLPARECEADDTFTKLMTQFDHPSQVPIPKRGASHRLGKTALHRKGLPAGAGLHHRFGRASRMFTAYPSLAAHHVLPLGPSQKSRSGISIVQGIELHSLGPTSCRRQSQRARSSREHPRRRHAFDDEPRPYGPRSDPLSPATAIRRHRFEDVQARWWPTAT